MDLRRLWAVLLAAALVACGGANPDASPTVAANGAGPPVTDLGLPGCGKPPSPAPEAAPAGALLPPGTTVTAVRDQPPITQFNAYVEMTPVQVREWVESRPGLEVLSSEDEGLESELLVSDGEYNTFVKAAAVCADASLLAEVIAPAEADATLPTPAGGGTPGSG